MSTHTPQAGQWIPYGVGPVTFPAWFWSFAGSAGWGISLSRDGSKPSSWTHWMPCIGTAPPSKPDTATEFKLVDLETAAERDRLKEALIRLIKAQDASCDQFTAKEIDEIEAAMTQGNASLSSSPTALSELARLREEKAELVAAAELALIVVTRDVREGRCPSGVENSLRSAIAKSQPAQKPLA